MFGNESRDRYRCRYRRRSQTVTRRPLQPRTRREPSKLLYPHSQNRKCLCYLSAPKDWSASSISYPSELRPPRCCWDAKRDKTKQLATVPRASGRGRPYVRLKNRLLTKRKGSDDY